MADTGNAIDPGCDRVRCPPTRAAAGPTAPVAAVARRDGIDTLCGRASGDVYCSDAGAAIRQRPAAAQKTRSACDTSVPVRRAGVDAT